MYFYFTERSRFHACYAHGKNHRSKPVKPIFTFRGSLVNYEIQFNRESKLLGVKHGVKKGGEKKGERERKRRYYGFLSFLFFFSPLPSFLPRYAKTLIRRLDDERLTIGYVNLRED